MNWRRLAVAGAGVLAGVAVANRGLAARAGDLPPPLPGETRTYRWRGLDVSYAEAGDPADEDLLLLHGLHAAASSKEFDAVFDGLASEYHVVAPDLPGFGRSDRPPVVYSAALYEAFVNHFARERTDDPICVASSLTAALAMRAAKSGEVGRMVLVCPTAETGERRRWLRTLLRSPVLGAGLFNALASRRSIRRFYADQALYDPAALSDERVSYDWRTAHQPGARFAPASFVSGYLDPDVDLQADLDVLDIPVTLLWGREAEVVPLQEGRRLAEEGDTRLVVVDYAKLLPHVEHPDRFLSVLTGELPRPEHQ